MAKKKRHILKVPAVRAKVLGVKVYRGFAGVADLADARKQISTTSRKIR